MKLAPESGSASELHPERWVERYGQILYRFALKKVRRTDVAEDLVQETLLAAWRNRDTFLGAAREEVWLVGILKRKIIDWLRASIRERQTQNALDLPESYKRFFNSHGFWTACPASYKSDDLLVSEEFWEALRFCSDQLPGRLRDVFVLWQLEELSTPVVCEQVGIQPANLWVILHRARHRLWECLTEQGFGFQRTAPTEVPK
jgi:RNA polymerase sigma-70 factor (TIGR02943 family)